MNVEEKMKVLKGNKEWKCNMKWEVLEEVRESERRRKGGRERHLKKHAEGALWGLFLGGTNLERSLRQY